MMKNKTKNQKGFALLTAIIITGMLLLVSFVVADLSYKELILTSTGQQSQIAFYMADSGAECALYWDLKNGPTSAFDVNTPGQVTCNNQTVTTGSQTVQTIPTQQSQVGGGGGGSGSPIALINAGGGSYTDSNSRNWSADFDYSGGGTYSTGNSISGTSDQTLYQTEHYGNTIYTISGMIPGSVHAVILKFAEIYWSTSGSRKFNVLINGTTVLSNFDIVADIGSAFKADDKSFSATADSGGNIVIQFVTVVDNAKISAIEVDSSSSSATPSIFQINFANSCAIVQVTKNADGTTKIDSRGYNTCDTSVSRRFERGITITY
jgi:hypothetical protein